jgi:hypothetical protein
MNTPLKKNFLVVLAILVLVIDSSCKKDDGGTGPTPDPEFPSSSKFAVTLYTAKSTLSVNESFDVKAVLYNVTNVFGAALEVGYPSAKIQVLGTTAGTAFFPAANVLTISQVEADSQRVGYGVTYKAGTSTGSSGSGIVVTFQCKALATGAVTLTINASKLELKKSDGNPITGFSGILKENLPLTIQ